MLTDWFNILGWPESIRSDNGPQYRTEFEQFCNLNNIEHQTSSPYNPQSNGLAEAGVKNAKHLLTKCMQTGENFQRALSAWRNIPREDGSSPAEIMFGRKQRTKLPTLPSQLSSSDRATAVANRDKMAQKHTEYFNKTAKPLSVFEPGQLVRVKDHMSDKWDKIATIVSRRKDNLSYVIDIDGKEYVRGRRLLKSTPPPEAEEINTHETSEALDEDKEPRRSKRAHKSPDRYGFPSVNT